MRNAHEPDDNFVEKLEWQIGREVRRRNSVAQAPGWLRWSRAQIAGAAATLIIVSMAIGGAAVAAAYEAQNNQRRDQLTVNVEQRLRLAEQRLSTLKEELQTVQQRASVGIATNAELVEGQNRVSEAEVQVQKVQLDLEEVRVTGVEPRYDLSAPLVRGRDFASLRLKLDMTVVERALALEKARLKDAQTRFELGVTDASAVDVARIHLIELDAAQRSLLVKLEARDRFVAGKADATETELRFLEAEAEQVQRSLTPKVDLARKEAARLRARVETGVAQQVDLTMASVKRLELEMALSKADLDLMLIRGRIDKHRAGK